ncbi:phage holin family protein [Patescibacteria group bacterium]|nr:phage holin family protein [Patescibacteria group bacterium]MBU4368823.1 phage holin family protein [Patescibacteria group bacterium]
MRFVYQILVNAIAIKTASYFIPGFVFSGDLVSLAWVSFLLTLANFFLKPVLKLIAGPIIFLTFGLFIVVINMIMLYAVDYYTPELKISGVAPLFWGTILVGAVNTVFSIFKK